MAANTAVLVCADTVRTDLPGQVDLHTGVDRHNLVIFSNNGWVIYIINIQKSQARIIIQEVIQPFGAQGKAGHDTVGVQVFVTVINDIFFKKINHPVTQHFGMYTQVFMIAQVAEHRIRNSTDAHL
ncbi:hypothetical protein D3C72_634140 [compost metagenome]